MTHQAIKKLRNELKLTQAQFAQVLGTEKSSVWRWEKTKRKPSKFQMLLMQQYLMAAQYTRVSETLLKIIITKKDAVEAVRFLLNEADKAKQAKKIRT